MEKWHICSPLRSILSLLFSFLLSMACAAGLELRVASPKQGEPIIASYTDGFNMVFVLDDMGRTRQNCGHWTLSVVESDREVFSGVHRPCICSFFPSTTQPSLPTVHTITKDSYPSYPSGLLLLLPARLRCPP